jgi:AraC-like DNA-binding protein
MSETTAFATARYSSDDIPERDRLPIWREQISRTVFKIDLEPAKDVPFHSNIATCALGDLGILRTTFTRCHMSRKPVAADGDHLLLMTNYSGLSHVISQRRELSLQVGDATLLNGCEITNLHRHPGGGFGIRIPRTLLYGLVKDVDSQAMQRIPCGNDALSLLTGYVRTLLHDTELLLPEMRTLAYRHVIDLIAATLGPTSDAAEVILDRGVRAARLQAARAYIVQNTQQSLSVVDVAAHLCVTPRYVQRLFETEGTTFSAFLLELRLNLVHRMLLDPRQNANSVELIAFNAGFGDASYFYRNFRRRFGATPSDIRKPTRH